MFDFYIHSDGRERERKSICELRRYVCNASTHRAGVRESTFQTNGCCNYCFCRCALFVAVVLLPPVASSGTAAKIFSKGSGAFGTRSTVHFC